MSELGLSLGQRGGRFRIGGQAANPSDMICRHVAEFRRVGIRFLTVTVAISCVSSHATVGALFGDPDIATIGLTAASTARLINSAEYEARVVSSDGSSKVIRVFHEGQKRRMECRGLSGIEKGPDGPIPPWSGVFAYDGERYQVLHQHDSILEVQNSPRGMPEHIPQLVPFFWLTLGEGGLPSLSSIVDVELWKRRFSEARFIKETSASIVLEFPQSMAYTACTIQVHFSKNQGFFPLKHERYVTKTGKLSTACQVTEYQTIQVDGQTAIFPLHIEYRETGADGLSRVVETSTSVVPKSVRLNHDLDDGLFTISKDAARSFFDRDENAEAISRALIKQALGEIDAPKVQEQCPRKQPTKSGTD